MSTKDHPFVLETPHRMITLNGEEVRHLADAIAVADVSEGLENKEEYRAQGRKALLLLAGPYNELIVPDGVLPGPVDLSIDEETCWLFRARTKTGTVGSDGRTIIGAALLHKVHDCLLSFQVDLDVGTIEEPTISPEELMKRLEEFNAQHGTSPDSGSDEDHLAVPPAVSGHGPGLPDRPGQAVSGPTSSHHPHDHPVPTLEDLF